MKIKDRLDNYLYDREYKIIIKENSVNIINYDEIIDFTLTKISVKYNQKIITIEGYNLSIAKMMENEVLITGDIANVCINKGINT